MRFPAGAVLVRNEKDDENMEIVEVKEYTRNIQAAFERLLPQLISSSKGISKQELLEIIESPAARLLVAMEDGSIVGSLTLVLIRIPTGMIAWIEDVVVDKNARGKGVARQLIESGITLAKKSGARTVDLTSRPSRVEANNLYKKVGFVKRKTNVYRYNLT